MWNSYNQYYEWINTVHFMSDNTPIDHLKVRKVNGGDCITWDRLQEIKNYVFGEETRCIEVYPPQSALIDHANIRHLFVMPEDIPYPDIS